MNAVINAVGTTDSLGQDRASVPRGLQRFGGKTVIEHTLERTTESGFDKRVLVFVNPEQRVRYEQALKGLSVHIQAYHGETDPMSVYCAAVKTFLGETTLVIADDNLFDFSLDGMVKRMHEVHGSVVALRDARLLPRGQNFGLAVVDTAGKLQQAGYSHGSNAVEGDKVVLDIYLVNARDGERFANAVGHPATIANLAATWFTSFHAWEPDGFWADIGKIPLRDEAEKYFNNAQE